MKYTGFKDKNGKDIRLGSELLLEGEKYKVIVDDFILRIVIDNGMRRIYLSDVHRDCEVVTA